MSSVTNPSAIQLLCCTAGGHKAWMFDRVPHHTPKHIHSTVHKHLRPHFWDNSHFCVSNATMPYRLVLSQSNTVTGCLPPVKLNIQKIKYRKVFSFSLCILILCDGGSKHLLKWDQLGLAAYAPGWTLRTRVRASVRIEKRKCSLPPPLGLWQNAEENRLQESFPETTESDSNGIYVRSH